MSSPFTYDEDIADNKFFSELKTNPLFDIVADNHLYVCVPRKDTLLAVVLDNRTFQSHILRPDEDKQNLFHTLRNEEVLHLNDRLTLKEDCAGQSVEYAAVKILFEETHINEKDQKYKVLCISHPLTCLKTDADELDAVYGSACSSGNETFDYFCQSLFGDDKSGSFKKKIDYKLRDFAESILKDYDSEMSSKELADMVRKQYDSFYTSVLRRKEKPPGTIVYLYNLLYKPVLMLLASCVRQEEVYFVRTLRQLDSLTPSDLSIEPQLYDHINKAKSELACLNDVTTPYGKLLRLRKVVRLFTTQQNGDEFISDPNQPPLVISSDTILQVLVFLILKSNVISWCTNLEYMVKFHFSSAAVDELGYCLASFEAAMMYIRSGQLEKCIMYKMILPRVVTSRTSSFSGGSGDIEMFEFWNNLVKVIESENEKQLDHMVFNPSDSVDFNKNLTNSSDTLCHPLCRCKKCVNFLESNSPTSSSVFSGKVSVNASGFGGRTPLHIAAYLNRPNSVNVLVRKKANIEQRDDMGITPLHLACRSGAQAAILLLIHCNARLSSKDSKGNSPLHTACFYDKIESAKALIYQSNVQSDLSINSLNDADETPLHVAVRLGNDEMISFLLENDARIDLKNKDGMTSFDLAVSWHIRRLLSSTNSAIVLTGWEIMNEENNGRSRVSSTTPKHIHHNYSEKTTPGTDVKKSSRMFSKSKSDGFLKAVGDNDLPLVQFLVEESRSRSSSSCSGGGTTMTSSLSKCHPLCQCEKCLRINQVNAERVNINYVPVKSSTALKIAVARNFDEMVAYLIKEGAEVDLVSGSHQTTAFHVAAQEGLPEMVDILIENGADIEMPDKSGNRALHMAASRGHSNVVQSLLKNKINIDCVNDIGNSALHEATKWDRRGVMKLLLACGCDITLKNNSGDTVIDVVRSSEAHTMLKELAPFLKK